MWERSLWQSDLLEISRSLVVPPGSRSLRSHHHPERASGWVRFRCTAFTFYPPTHAKVQFIGISAQGRCLSELNVVRVAHFDQGTRIPSHIGWWCHPRRSPVAVDMEWTRYGELRLSYMLSRGASWSTSAGAMREIGECTCHVLSACPQHCAIEFLGTIALINPSLICRYIQTCNSNKRTSTFRGFFVIVISPPTLRGGKFLMGRATRVAKRKTFLLQRSRSVKRRMSTNDVYIPMDPM